MNRSFSGPITTLLSTLFLFSFGVTNGNAASPGDEGPTFRISIAQGLHLGPIDGRVLLMIAKKETTELKENIVEAADSSDFLNESREELKN